MMELHDASKPPVQQTAAADRDEVERLIKRLSSPPGVPPAPSPAPSPASSATPVSSSSPASSASPESSQDRRRASRKPLRTSARLTLVGITPVGKPEIVQTCDADAWGVGFFSRRALPVSAEATLTIVRPEHLTLHLDGYIQHCTEIEPGWHHAALALYRRNPAF